MLDESQNALLARYLTVGNTELKRHALLHFIENDYPGKYLINKRNKDLTQSIAGEFNLLDTHDIYDLVLSELGLGPDDVNYGSFTKTVTSTSVKLPDFIGRQKYLVIYFYFKKTKPFYDYVTNYLSAESKGLPSVKMGNSEYTLPVARAEIDSLRETICEERGVLKELVRGF